MGSLTPGATYVYERNGEEIYAREVGQSERKLIGHMYEKENDPRTSDGRPLYEHIKEDKMWGNIRRAAKDNPALQQALERVKILYYLTDDYEQRYGRSKT
jgi:hypothetical protein